MNYMFSLAIILRLNFLYALTLLLSLIDNFFYSTQKQLLMLIILTI